MRKARVDLHLDHELSKTQIAIDGVSIPCHGIALDLEVGRNPQVVLVMHGKFVGNEWYVDDYLVEHPIVEVIEADPLIMHDEFFK